MHRAIARRTVLLAPLWLGFSASTSASGVPKLSARIDGRDWISTRQYAVTFRFGASPALNVTGLLDGPPTSRLSFNLVLAEEDDFLHEFALHPAAAATSHATFTFNVMRPDSGDNVLPIDSGRFTIERYEPGTQTVSGSFAAHASNGAARQLRIEDGAFADIPVVVGR